MYDDDRIFFELEEDEKPKKKENVFFWRAKCRN